MKRVLEKAEKLVDLTREYIQSELYQKCAYHLIYVEGQYMLFNISTQENLQTGDITRIKSYCRLRKITFEQVYIDEKVSRLLQTRGITLPKAQVYEMCKTICNECPFRNNSLPGWLGPHTAEEILGVQQREGLFTCHKTRVNQDAEMGSKEIPICRGFIATASKSCKMFGSNPETGNGLKALQGEITPTDKALVLTRVEFKSYHEQYEKGL